LISQFHVRNPQALAQRMGHEDDLGVNLGATETQCLSTDLVKLTVALVEAARGGT
jgi:hypothetical protein